MTTSDPQPVEVQPPLIVLTGRTVNEQGELSIETRWAYASLPTVIQILRSTIVSLTDRLVDQILQTAVYAPVNVAGQDLISGKVPDCEGVECVADNDVAARERLRAVLAPYVERRLAEQSGLSVPHAHVAAPV